VYLAHPLFTLAAGTLLRGGWLQTLHPDALIVIMTLATIALSASTYPWVEGRLVKLGRSRRETSSATARIGLEPAREAP